MRITESEDGGLRVELLREGAWIEGPIRMAGLRLSSTTTRLTRAQAQALPA
jgi:hypothetical protein